jgi:HEAT repeat protein
MIPNPENPRRTDDGDPLDQLLQEAQWPRPIQEAEARLTQRWRDVWSAHRRRQMLARRAAALALAVSFLAAAAIGWGWLHPANEPEAPPQTVKRASPTAGRNGGAEAPVAGKSRLTHTAQRPTSSAPVAEAILSRSVVRNPRSTDDSEILAFSRPPNRLEEIMIGAFDRRGGNRTTVPENAVKRPVVHDASPGRSGLREVAASKVPPLSPSKSDQRKATAERERAAVQAAVDHLVADPKADPAPVAATLRSAPFDNESRLVSILTGGAPAQQLAAVRLLSEIGSSAAVPSLLQASGDPKLRTAAARAVARLADTPTINEIVRQQTDIELQRTLLAGLLARGDTAALGDYLNYVQSDTIGETALSAAELVQNPPMEMLFGVLQSPSELTRLAAARVIGRIDGPATTQRLIAMVEQGTSRQEACVALLSSRGEDAVNFVTNARANPVLAGLLQTASLFVSTNSQPRS